LANTLACSGGMSRLIRTIGVSPMVVVTSLNDLPRGMAGSFLG
jgi:hypothetical protein